MRQNVSKFAALSSVDDKTLTDEKGASWFVSELTYTCLERLPANTLKLEVMVEQASFHSLTSKRSSGTAESGVAFHNRLIRPKKS